MKKLIILLHISFLSFAQKDTIKVSFSEETVEKFEKTTLIDEYEKAFGGNRVVKTALRYRVFEDRNNPSGLFSLISVERKIGKDFSVIGGANANFGGLQGFIFGDFTLEWRWYYQMKKRIDRNLQNPNQTGKYISFFIERNAYHPNKSIKTSFEPPFVSSLITTIPPMLIETSSFSLKYGRQFGNILDVGLVFGIKNGKKSIIDEKGFWINNFNSPIDKTLFFSTNTSIGFGIDFPIKRKVTKSYCEFLKCNYNVKQLFKINLNNSIYLDKNIQNFRFDITYERKIGNSPFSLNTNFILGFNTFKGFSIEKFIDSVYTFNQKEFTFQIPIYNSEILKHKQYDFLIIEQLRYYVGMKDRIMKGKSGNNLNGLYIGGQVFFKNDLFEFGWSPKYSSGITQRKDGISGIVGYQTLTTKNIFLDFGFSIGLERNRIIGNPLQSSMPFNLINSDLTIKLGFAK